jgi:hypothetical protein
MKREEIKQVITDVVTRMQGCKATELASDESLVPLPINDFPGLLEEMIKEGRLVEIEYILPHLSYRIKSFLLPPGTEVR